MVTREDKAFQAFSHIVLMASSLMCVIPFVLLIIASLTDNGELIRSGYSFFPKVMSTDAYEYLFKTGSQIVTAYGVTLFVTAVGTVSSLLITILLAYPISRADFPGKTAISFLVFFTMLFNGGLVPTYLVYTTILSIKNTIWALLIPRLLVSGFFVMLMKSFFATSIPKEVIEAAKVDGAGEARTLVQVVLPMAKPMMATIGLLTAINYWNDWYNSFIYITTKTQYYSIQGLLNRMIQDIQYLTNNASNLGAATEALAKIPSASVRMAVAVVGAIPIMVIYPFLQNNFVKGISLGAVKG